MSLDRRSEIDAVLDAALDCPPDRLDAFLDHRCGDDHDLRRAVTALLAAHARADGLLDTPLTDLDPRPAPPAEVGPYRVGRLIGSGGMGSVYLGERHDGGTPRQAAVKIVEPGFDPIEVRRRFQIEQRILAALDHPDIARLLDGGFAVDGRPYLVMEFVDGERIDRYCDRERLDAAARIRLFCRVARAVHHAHRQLVVHRDLKPSNILIGLDGGPKLLDFGIAKILEHSALDTGGTRTRTGVRPMTPEYASPEQLRGEPVTVASDVYALGIVLSELLASPRVGRSGDQRAALPDASIGRILVRALEPAPEQRYPSAEALALELERHLAGQPTDEPRPGRRRHTTRLVLALAGALVVAAVGVAIRDRSMAAAARGARLDQLAADLAGVGSMTDTGAVRTMLDTGARLVDYYAPAGSTRRPALLGGLARGYARLGVLPRAETLARLALDDRLGAGSSTEAELALAEADLARILAAGAAVDEAIGHFHRAILHRQRSGLGPDSTLARIRSELAWAFRSQADYESAGVAFQQALEEQQSALGLDHPDRALTLLGLATIEQARGRLADAKVLTERALAGFDAGAAVRNGSLPPGARDAIAALLTAVGRDREAAVFAAGPQPR